VYGFQGIKTTGIALRIGDTIRFAINPAGKKAHVLMKEGRDRPYLIVSAELKAQSKGSQWSASPDSEFTRRSRMENGLYFSSTALAGLGLNLRNKPGNSVKRGRLSYGKGWRMLSVQGKQMTG
jgi:hypothetical protein